MTEEINKALRELSKEVGGLTAELSSFKSEYSEGKKAARASAQTLSGKIDGMNNSVLKKAEQTELNDVKVEVTYKFDKREFTVLKKFATVLQNWVAVALVVLALGYVGAITIRPSTLKFILGAVFGVQR